ncbi:hypothetical protein [Porphyromonas canoris]|uniref:Uncharacterized protein n=1 Tax=Porphyromonas canoris TaxID=36875 RepID=A0ABR4XN20_9PORP|nr:hypothetical protein [Porphyromonas canoris]KGN93472.1 hypothetical protein HQ43_02245 [Porphyromonas canoris]
MGAFIMLATIFGLIGFFVKQISKQKEKAQEEEIGTDNVFDWNFFGQKSVKGLSDEFFKLKEKSVKPSLDFGSDTKEIFQQPPLDVVPPHSIRQKYDFKAEAEGKTFQAEYRFEPEEEKRSESLHTQSEIEDYIPDNIEEWRRAIIFSELLKRRF